MVEVGKNPIFPERKLSIDCSFAELKKFFYGNIIFSLIIEKKNGLTIKRMYNKEKNYKRTILIYKCPNCKRDDFFVGNTYGMNARKYLKLKLLSKTIMCCYCFDRQYGVDTDVFIANNTTKNNGNY